VYLATALVSVSVREVAREGRILRDGTCRRNAPYRYCLPAKAEAWRQDPIHPDNLPAWIKAQGAQFADGETVEE